MKNIHVKKNTAKIIVRKLYYILHTKYIYDDIYDNLHDFFFFIPTEGKKSGKKTKHSIYCIQKKKKNIDITKHEKITWGGGRKKINKSS